MVGPLNDTYDGSGKVIETRDPSVVTRERLEEMLESLRGTIEQIPPMYSAVKYKGKHLYEFARAGIEVERKARKVHISRLELVSWQSPIIIINVECSKGTYIRSLAHDLGQALGCGAHPKNLVRLKHGLFDIEHGLTLPQLENAFRYGCWMNFLYPIDMVLLHWKAAIVGERSERLLRNGCPLPIVRGGENSDNQIKEQLSSISPYSKEERCRVYTIDGRFFAVLRRETEEVWHPDKVFRNLGSTSISVKP